MRRLSKNEIDNTLLSGRALSWKGAGGKTASIVLATVAQRRLFNFLLNHIHQQSIGCTTDFIEGLSEAYLGTDDPANSEALSTNTGTASSWRIQSLICHNFGGVNAWAGDEFRYDFDCESLTIEGPNGSGKSSLAAAIIWLFTGQRPRDHLTPPAGSFEPVLNQSDKEIGRWPPIAAYPSKSADLSISPEVKVEATLKDAEGTTFTIYRHLKSGAITSNLDQVFDIPEVFLSTGLVMPSRIGHIRLKEGANGLTEAVQQLTGLDEVVMLGELCDWLTHGAREYKSFSKTNKLSEEQSVFSSNIESARSTLAIVARHMPPFAPIDAKTDEDPLALLGQEISASAKSLTEGLTSDLSPELKVTEVATQKRLTQNIEALRARLDQGLAGLTAWQALLQLESATADSEADRLLKAAATADASLKEAIEADLAAQADSRRQLKALAAAWHNDQHANETIEDCPLCEQSLKNVPQLQAELQALKAAGEAATRKFSDNVNQISEALKAELPLALTTQGLTLQGKTPAAVLLQQFNTTFGSGSSDTKDLPAFSALANSYAANAPSADLNIEAPQSVGAEAQKKLLALIAWVIRCEEIGRWVRANKEAWQDWWITLDAPTPAPLGGGTTHQRTEAETLRQHIDRLTNSMEAAEPYSKAARYIGLAIAAARKILQIEAEQKKREDICQAITRLKELKSVGESTARQAIEELSTRIQTILKGMHTTERLHFHNAHLAKKEGLIVRAGFSPDVRLDATLIANTSWLRAVLWAFIFALREEAVEQYTYDPLPVFVFDDPQATFDISHRLNWAHYVAGLQVGTPKAQMLITTHDQSFLLTLEMARISSRFANISPARPESGPLVILDGDALERKWRACDDAKSDPSKAVAFLDEARVFVDGMLQSILTGDGAELTRDSVSALGTRIKNNQSKGVAPWTRPIFERLIKALKGPPVAPELALIEHAHHPNRANLTYAEASQFYKYWKSTLASPLKACFQDMCEHRLLHGTVSAWKLPPPTVEFPEGFTEVVKDFAFPILGRVSALSNGRVSEGRFSYEDIGPEASRTVRLGNHQVFRLSTHTLEPVANPGSVVIVQNFGNPTDGSLVVARVDEQLMARRFVISDRNTDIAVLTAHAVDPHNIAAPVVAHRATFTMHKIVGVMFDAFYPRPPGSPHEIMQCAGEAEVRALLKGCAGLVEVVGQSAQPIALDGQLLFVGERLEQISARTLQALDGKPVVASDDLDGRYFKRLRVTPQNNKIVILESLDGSGDYGPEILGTPDSNAERKLTTLWPVLGVLFELPAAPRQ